MRNLPSTLPRFSEQHEVHLLERRPITGALHTGLKRTLRKSRGSAGEGLRPPVDASVGRGVLASPPNPTLELTTRSAGFLVAPGSRRCLWAAAQFCRYTEVVS